nr:Lj965 prophage replication protein [uncultured Mediterranean phage uvMED]
MEKVKKGFAMIPNQLIYDENIGNEAKVLFCYIRSLSENYRNLRNSNLCQKLGCSVNTLQKAKKELIDNGYLVINRLSSANKYLIRLPKNRVVRVSKFKQSDYPKIGYHYKSNNINNNNNSNKGFKKFKKFKE